MKVVSLSTEKDIFTLLKIDYVPPECRIGYNEVGKNFDHLTDKLPDGELHAHTKWSDGILSIDELLREAKEQGYEFFGISDHTASMPRGVAEDRIDEYINEIKQAGAKYMLPVYAGLEVEVNVESELVYSVESLQKLDYVILCIHHAIGKNMVNRYVSAIKKLREADIPVILAHPTGRLFGTREFDENDDWNYLWNACATFDVLIEVNCQPDRLDPPTPMIATAAAFGCKFILGTDIHGSIERHLIIDGQFKCRSANRTNKDLILTRSDLNDWIMTS